MAIDRSILGILERSKKSWNFDVFLNGQKNRRMSAKTAQGRENPPRPWTGGRISENHVPRAATCATRKVTLDCGKWTIDRWKEEKWQVKEKRQVK